MIICPNTGDECTIRFIKPLSRTAFLIISYPKNDNEQIKEIQKIEHTINEVFKSKGYKIILARNKKGRNLYCKICQQIQSVPIGIILHTKTTPTRSLPNIFFEVGVMTTLGKEIILLKDYKTTIPSDLHGLEWTSFKDMEDLKNQLSKQIEEYQEISEYYSLQGKFFIKKGDFELATNYLKRAYMLFPQDEILNSLRDILNTLEKKSRDKRYYALKGRITDDIRNFLENVK